MIDAGPDLLAIGDKIVGWASGDEQV
ncbi:MAG: hypothetical protein QOG39_1413, partial [Acidimicrobiaceae bacterium]